MVGVIGNDMAINDPAAPAKHAPTAKVIAKILSILTPINSAASMSIRVALIARPVQVRSMKRRRPIPKANAMKIKAMR